MKLKIKKVMAERKEITKLYVVTDSETSYDNIGDIDGGMFDDKWLEQYIKIHGAGQLLEKLASMTSAVITMKYNIQREESEINCVDASVGNGVKF